MRTEKIDIKILELSNINRNENTEFSRKELFGDTFDVLECLYFVKAFFMFLPVDCKCEGFQH